MRVEYMGMYNYMNYLVSASGTEFLPMIDPDLNNQSQYFSFNYNFFWCFM